MTLRIWLFRKTSAAFILLLGIWIIWYWVSDPGDVKIDKRKYPVTGLDMSGHTGHIDFIKISAHKIDFIYIKATEGKTFVDRNFELNYKNSRLSSVPVGFYHFSGLTGTGKSKPKTS